MEKNKKSNKTGKKPPLFVTGFSISDNDALAANNDQGLLNNLELQNRSPDCQAKFPKEILTQSQEQTLLADNEGTDETNRSSISESTIANQIEHSGNSTFTKSTTPTVFMSDTVCDNKDDDGLAPCTSIYADPVSVVKSKGPPVVI